MKTYTIPLYTIRLVRDGNVKSHNVTITSPADTHRVIAGMLADVDREQMLVILLDTKNKMIGVQVAFVGTINAINISMRELFKPAIVSSAASIIIAHNHPSGDPTPSPEDVAVTRDIVAAGKLLDIIVLDHIIIGVGEYGERFYSMNENGQGF